MAKGDKKITKFVDLAPGVPTEDPFFRTIFTNESRSYGSWGEVSFILSNNYQTTHATIDFDSEADQKRAVRVLNKMIEHLAVMRDNVATAKVGGPTKPKATPKKKKKA